MTLLGDKEWCKWSDGEIGRRCAVGRDLVGSLRPSLAENASEKTYTTKHGTVATMDTSNIGRGKPHRKRGRGGRGERQRGGRVGRGGSGA